MLSPSPTTDDQRGTAFHGRQIMRKFRHIVSIAVAGAVVLLVTTCLATAAEAEQPLAKTAPATGKTTRSAAAAPTQKRSAVALAAQPAAAAGQKEHRLILQVNTNDA